MNNVLIANNNVLYSELQEDENSLIAKFIICDFGINGNNVMLNRKTIDSWLDTIISQPVVAAIGVNDDGTCDFEGHNVSVVSRVGEDGQVYQDMKFDTSAIGAFDSVEIATINNKEYIVATAKLWKRYPDFCALIRKRMSEGSIATSWEIAVDSSHFEIIGGQKVKVIDKGSFLGHALLNNNFPPAYQDSKMLEVASKNQSDSDLIEALKRDIVACKDSNIHIIKKEDEILDKGKENIVSEYTIKETKEVSTETTDVVKTENTETSALTEFDLRQALRQAIADKLNIDKWEFYIIYNFPTDGIIWIQLWDAESELDVIKFTYTVENDVVTMSEPENAKLTVSVAQIDTKIAELNATIEKQNTSLVEASTKVQDLTKEVSELTPFKESCEKAEQERIEKETAEKRENLKGYAIKSGFISEDEISSVDEIKNCVENVDEKGLKAIIAERFMKSLDNKTDVETSTLEDNKVKDVETSEVRTNIVDSEEVDTDYKSVMKSFLNK